jgi:hypothetical protein
VSAIFISSASAPFKPHSQEILISLKVGNAPLGLARDWLTGQYPLFLYPGQMVWWLPIEVDALNPAAISGPLKLHWQCCQDASTGAPVTPRGLYVWALPRPACQLFPPIGSGYVVSRIFCPPALSPLTLNVTSIPSQAANLIIQTASFATPGEYIAKLQVDSATGAGSYDVYITVLPATWPADGPLQRCVSTNVISLGTINPTPPVWKSTHPGAKTYSIGVWFDRSETVGMQFHVVPPAGFGPIQRNVATINFYNERGWPVGIRAIDSRNCSSGQQFVVRRGEEVSFTIDRTNTTTLIFSKSTCRAWLPWFDCWGQSGLGFDDVYSFSEGPFWALFGGRTVNMTTKGDWGALPTPDSIAVIRIP